MEDAVRAAIFRNGEIVTDTLPEPVPGAGQVLVKTLACGICGSDLHARRHAHRMAEMTRHLNSSRKPMDPSRDVVFVKAVIEASEGLAAMFAERGGDLTLVAHRSQEKALDRLIVDLERERLLDRVTDGADGTLVTGEAGQPGAASDRAETGR